MLLAIGLVADDELCGIKERVVEVLVYPRCCDDQRQKVALLALDVEVTFVFLGVRVQMHASGLFLHKCKVYRRQSRGV